MILSATADADFTVYGGSILPGWEFVDGFGNGLFAAGDLDSDSYNDFLIGANGLYTATGTHPLNGKAYIVFGGDTADGTVLDVTNPDDRITTISPDSGQQINLAQFIFFLEMLLDSEGPIESLRLTKPIL